MAARSRVARPQTQKARPQPRQSANHARACVRTSSASPDQLRRLRRCYQESTYGQREATAAGRPSGDSAHNHNIMVVEKGIAEAQAGRPGLRMIPEIVREETEFRMKPGLALGHDRSRCLALADEAAGEAQRRNDERQRYCDLLHD